MKGWFDKSAKIRQLSPGDKVLVFLPIPGSSLQARSSGPYVIQRKASDSDYIVSTPDHAKRSRLCHINMLKPLTVSQWTGSALMLILSWSRPLLQFLLSYLCLYLALQVSDCPLSLSGAEVLPDACESLSSPDAGCDIEGPSLAPVEGRLRNSEMLSNLPTVICTSLVCSALIFLLWSPLIYPRLMSYNMTLTLVTVRL